MKGNTERWLPWSYCLDFGLTEEWVEGPRLDS